jgi:hypothetical protein
VNKIILGIKRDTKKFLLTLLVSIPAVWGTTKPFIDMTGFDPKSKVFISVIIAAIVILAIVRIYPKQKVSFKLKGTNTKVIIEFGDIWKERHNVVVAANEYFDSAIGKCVSPKSLHGQFISNILGGKQSVFDDEINKSLRDVDYQIEERVIGKSFRYEIGTVGLVTFSDVKYLILAMSKSNDKYEAYTTPSSFLTALAGLWGKARSECNGFSLSLPLIGSGLGRLGLPEMSIIELILISALSATRESEITSEIRLILHASNFEDIDLRQIESLWK